MQNPDSDASSLIKGGAVKLDHPDRGDDDPLPQSGYDSKNYDFKSEDIVI